jgi:hypothetical protein
LPWISFWRRIRSRLYEASDFHSRCSPDIVGRRRRRLKRMLKNARGNAVAALLLAATGSQLPSRLRSALIQNIENACTYVGKQLYPIFSWLPSTSAPRPDPLRRYHEEMVGSGRVCRCRLAWVIRNTVRIAPSMWATERLYLRFPLVCSYR